MNESDIKRKIMKYLKESGGWWFKVYSGMGMARAGIPDIIGCVEGKFIAIEVKTEIGKLTALQEDTLTQISANFGRAMVVYGYKDFLNKIKLYLGG